MTADLKPSTSALPQMTLRQWYAGQALAGSLASHELMLAAWQAAKKEGQGIAPYLASSCLEYADAMISALKETGDA